MAYSLSTNLSLTERTGVVQVADQLLTIIQGAVVCQYALAGTNQVFDRHGHGPGGGEHLCGCGWAVDNTNSWITILSAPNQTGNGIVEFTVATNTTALARSGSFSVAGSKSR